VATVPHSAQWPSPAHADAARRHAAMEFRLLDTPPGSGAWNMALDEALIGSVSAGAPPALRFFRWSPACLSLGRNQPARGLYDLDAIRSRGLDVVRRPTGGRAVLHDRELTYSVVVPADLLGGPRRCYAAVNRALVRGLRRLGVDAALQPRDGRRAAMPSLAPCFGDAAEGEVVVGGRKLVGSAQRRDGAVLLQHGSLLLAGDQSAVGMLLRGGAEPANGAPPPVTLVEVLGTVPEWEDLTRSLVSGWQEEFGAGLVPGLPSDDEDRRAADLVARFRDPAWTWRK